ncbi:MAG: TIGR03936 family radical SAM-associated protein [Clostridia bacterium]|nr:TIGR03936 family radical SAM-associated protein [Clostridia bacterium]
MEKIRFIYSISKEAVYLTQIDLVRIFEKALKELKEWIKTKNLSENSLKPQLVFACSLPVGMESTGEILEIPLTERVPIAFFIKEMNNVLPSGITILAAEYVDAEEESIRSRVYASIYEIQIVYDESKFINKNKSQIDEIKNWYICKMKEYMEQENILVVKKSESRMERIDIKKQILGYNFLIDGNLQVSVDDGIKYALKPEYIVKGYNEYIDQNMKCNIKRLKILYK